jgi:general secretion pathway protein A
MDYNHPAILEFSLSSGIKKYALLTKVLNGQPVLTFDKNYNFPLSDVLSHWDGYFMVLAQLPDIKPIYPGQTSEQIVWLRERMRLKDGISTVSNRPNYFDADLKTRVIQYQHNHQLTPDGIVGTKTLLHLAEIKGNQNIPRLVEK